ncbi:MAG TPA: methyltransferase domain-containing protein [Melioribacteraceae bacterium]|nr:methyltransferase domain-containing protein [Melioribacteraceae bacterium]
MSERTNVCPVELSGSLDNKLRKIFQNPKKILNGFLREGIKVADIGCGPGFFTIEIAKIVGNNGKVYAVDLQEGMLQKVKAKIKDTELQNIVVPIKCAEDKIEIPEEVDFMLAFFMVHEVPDKLKFFTQLKSCLKKRGKFLIVEPKHFHVSVADFEITLSYAKQAGFNISSGIKMFLTQSAVLSL